MHFEPASSFLLANVAICRGGSRHADAIRHLYRTRDRSLSGAILWQDSNLASSRRMPVHTSFIELSTRGNTDVADITASVGDVVQKSGLASGVGCVFAPGATAGITTIEYEPGCIADLVALFERLAPELADYEHHRRWGDGNGHSHLRAALLGPSLSFPFDSSGPCLGTWQQIILVDFDNRPRSRVLRVHLVGE